MRTQRRYRWTALAVAVPTALTGMVAVVAVASHQPPGADPRTPSVELPDPDVDSVAGADANVAGEPPAAKPAPTDTQERATRLQLGEFGRPASDVQASSMPPAGAPIDPEIQSAVRAGTRATLTLRRNPTPTFSAVGVTWTSPRSAAATVSLAVRVVQHGRWGSWHTAATAERANDAGPHAGRVLRDGTELQWFGPATGVEVAVTQFGDVPASDVAVELIDPGQRAADQVVARLGASPTATGAEPTDQPSADQPAAGQSGAGQPAAVPGPGSPTGPAPSTPAPAATTPADSPAPSAPASSDAPSPAPAMALAASTGSPYLTPREPMPTIRRRSQWGANERWMGWDHEYLPEIRAAAIHHTATTNNYSATQVPAILRSIYHYQAISEGWGDIGYTVLVDRFGRIWEGRSGGVASAVIGAHTGGFNSYVAGIGVIGNHTSKPMSATQIASISRYLAWKFTLGSSFDPRGKVHLTGGGSTSRWKYPTTITMNRIFGHRNTNYTACPGNAGMRALPKIRALTTRYMGSLINPARIRLRPTVWRPSTGQWFVRGISAPVITSGRNDLPVAADYDGDGTTDLALYRPSTGLWRIWRSHSRTVLRFSMGGPGWTPLSVDTNGDGTADPVIFSSSTGFWRRYGAAQVRFGYPNDLPAPADYNGDGVEEFSVYRPSTGYWYVSGRTPIHFGGPTDVPVPADYDGDGADERAAWSDTLDRVLQRLDTVVTWSVLPGDQPLPGQWDGDLADDRLVWGVQGGHARWLLNGRSTIVYGLAGDTPVPAV